MSNASANDVSSKLELLRQRFRDKAVAELDSLDQIARSIVSRDADCDQLAQAYRVLHRLAGSAGTFGFTPLGEEARRLEVWVKPFVDECVDGSPFPEGVGADFCDRLRGLRHMLEASDTRGYETVRGDARSTATEPLVLIIEPDGSVASGLMKGLALYGYQSALLPDLRTWHGTVEVQPSVVIVRDEVFLASSDRLSGIFPDLPIICVGKTDSHRHRYDLAREGAEAFFCEPLNLPVVADHLERILSDHADASNGRVLIVEDDAELVEHYQLVLSDGGFEVQTVMGDPSLLLPALSEFRPDIVLMDVQMGNISGPVLARMLRFEPEWLSLPIVYLSAETDRDMQLQALANGGDDFLTKPVSDAFLLRTVRIRCYRARQLDKLVSRDSLTGLLKHSLVKSEVAKEHARCRRMKHVSAVAMLDLDHFKKINDTQGHRAGDLVIKGLANLLRNRLRKTDIIGRYGGEEFLVALSECSLDQAEIMLRAVCEDFSQIVFEGSAGEFSVTLSAGLSMLSDYNHPEEAVEAADQALYQRKRGGRNGVSSVSL